jgi:hypothetical protein
MALKKFRIKYRAMKIDDGQLLAETKAKAKKRFIAAYKEAHGKGSHIQIISVVEDK